MAKPDYATIADRVMRAFMAPLVLGGELVPGRPIGARVALTIGEERVAADADLLSYVLLARVRVARKIVAVDRFDAPTPAEWALSCALHDLVQSTHPDLGGVLRRRSAARLLDLVDATVERTAAPPTLMDAVSRHTWFSRALELRRTDTSVSWWVGSSHFLGVDPPTRLSAWPELRRVQVERTPRTLMDLPSNGGNVDAPRVARSLAGWLEKTPLTDLATASRKAPFFAWSAGTLSLVGASGGRALALRAMAREPSSSVDLALGRATRALLASKHSPGSPAASAALSVLADRALADALTSTSGASAASKIDAATTDATFARTAGALVAREQIAAGRIELPADARHRALVLFETIARSNAAREIEASVSAAVRA